MYLNSNEEKQIQEVVSLYFQGTYYGDEEKLQRAFHKDAHIVGSIYGDIQDWTLREFIERVTVKPTAAEKKEEFDKQILSIDVTNDIAIVKTRVVAGEYTFTDYISLIKLKDQWIIRYKSFTT